MTPRLVPAGDRALVVEFEATISADVNCKVRALELLLLRAGLDGIVETVPSFRSLLVYYDPLRVAYRELCDVLAQMAGQASADVLPAPRRIELPCCYDDPELGFELRAAAEKLALSTDELIRIHSGDEYLVYFLGFAPGQPYMTGRAGRLAIPRLPTPRTRTPAGSVGIGGAQCCIYSVESPGGFWVLGRTPVRLFDPGAAEPILLQAGDIVHFRRIVRAEYAEVEDAVARRVYQPEIG